MMAGWRVLHETSANVAIEHAVSFGCSDVLTTFESYVGVTVTKVKPLGSTGAPQRLFKNGLGST